MLTWRSSNVAKARTERWDMMCLPRWPLELASPFGNFSVLDSSIRRTAYLVKAPRDRTVVDGAATRLVPVSLCRDRGGAPIRVRPPCDGLALWIRAQILSLEVAQFVLWAKVFGRKTRAALQADDFHTRLAELGRENSACCADTDYNDIRFFGGHGSCPPRRSLRLQADQSASCECLFALHIRRRECRMCAGEAYKAPSGEVLVAAVDRVGEHAFHRMCAHGVEERWRTRPGEFGGLVLLERHDHLVLTRGIELHE